MNKNARTVLECNEAPGHKRLFASLAIACTLSACVTPAKMHTQPAVADKSQADEDDDAMIVPLLGTGTVAVAAARKSAVQTASMVIAEGGGPLGGISGAGGTPQTTPSSGAGMVGATGATASTMAFLGFIAALKAASGSF